MQATLCWFESTAENFFFSLVFHCQAFTISHNLLPQQWLLISYSSHSQWPWPPCCFVLHLPPPCWFFVHPSSLPLWSPAVIEILTTFWCGTQPKSMLLAKKKKKKKTLSCSCTLIGQCCNGAERSHLFDKSSVNTSQTLRDFRLIKNEFALLLFFIKFLGDCLLFSPYH